MFGSPRGVIGVNCKVFYQHDVIEADSDVIRKWRQLGLTV